jgi:hypothetical protein
VWCDVVCVCRLVDATADYMLLAESPRNVATVSQYAATVRVPISGRQWVLQCTGGEALWLERQSPAQWIVSLFIAVVSALIALALHRNNKQLTVAGELLQRLGEARDEAVHANATKSEFLAFLVHTRPRTCKLTCH